MTKCLLKALKAVNLQHHIELFLLLGYDSAGALAHFHPEHFKQLHLTESESARFRTLLDVLIQAKNAGKICPHYSKSTRPSRTTTRNDLDRRSTTEDAVQYRAFPGTNRNSSHENRTSTHDLTKKRSRSSTATVGRSLSTSLTRKNQTNGLIKQRATSMIIKNPTKNQNGPAIPKAVTNRPAVEHIKAKSYDYGVPTNKQQHNSNNRVQYQNEKNNSRNNSIFVNSSRNSGEIMSYAKPAEIYVYARKRPLLSSEHNFQDIISVPNNKALIIAENKSNLDSTPLLKKTEFQFDHVFAADASNKQVFEHTLRSFLSSKERQNLTYICFGQTGSGKSHTIFGSRNTDGLLAHCTQWLLQELTSHSKLIGMFYEIYNNQVYDLASTGKRLVVREDSNQHVHVIGGTETVLKNLDILRLLIDDGLNRRHHGKSAFNSNSSRSHAVFQITFKDNHQKADSFKLTFIDLAGSERATDAKNNLRETRREGAQINSSLLALKECIRSMDLTQSHAPFRQSKLTHILRDSLVGSRTRTCLLANVTPADDCCQCSLNTLQYASRIRDISIRHRHRSIPLTILQSMPSEEENRSSSVSLTKQKSRPQAIFRPGTASTPVHRLVSSVDQRVYMTTSDFVTSDVKIKKPSNVDWSSVQNDRASNRTADEFLSKPMFSSTREHTSHNQRDSQPATTSFYLTKLEKQQPKIKNENENVSSYFPAPQEDIKISLNNNANRTKTIPTDTIIRSRQDPVEVQWKSVPAPSALPSSRRLSDSSIEPSVSTRLIPVATAPLSDDNQYSSTTVSESLGTKITKLASGTNLPTKKNKVHGFVENLNLNKNYDTATSTVTSDTEQGFYSDRQSTHRDQTGFFSNRDDPYYGGYLPSNPLPSIAQETSSMLSPARTPTQSYHQNSEGLATSSFRNQSQNSYSSPLKDHSRHRAMQQLNSSQSSSSSENAGRNRSPSPYRRESSNNRHRIIPLRIDKNSDDEDINQRDCSFQQQRNDLSTHLRPLSTLNDTPEQFENLTHRSTSPKTPKYQFKSSIDLNDHVQDSVSPNSPSLFSPSADHRIRLSDHLNTIRSLLESRLRDDDEIQVQSRKESSLLQSSPGTFAKEFLRSYRQSSEQDELSKRVTDNEYLEDDYLQSSRRNQSYFDRDNTYNESSFKSSTSFSRYGLPTSKYDESGLSYDHKLRHSTIIGNEIGSSGLPSAQSLIGQNEKRESRILLNTNPTSVNDRSVIDSHRPSLTESDLTEVTSNPTSGSAQTVLTETLSEKTGSNSSASALPLTDSVRNHNSQRVHDTFFDSGKGSSLLSGTSFDALMNSLRSMREKDLDFITERKDDVLIRVNH